MAGPLAPIFGTVDMNGLTFALSTAAAGVTQNPTADAAAQAPSLSSGDIPATAADAYRRAADAAPLGCGLSWTLLAAIGRGESNHGRYGGAMLAANGTSAPPILGPRLDGTRTARIPDTDDGRLDGDSSVDRAVGPMQFIPSTWSTYARDGNADGTADPFNVYDATAAAAAYLCAAGGDLSTAAGQSRAVFAYNHSSDYVATVLSLAAAYAGQSVPASLPGPDTAAVLPPVNPAPPPAVHTSAPVPETSPAVATSSQARSATPGAPALSSTSSSAPSTNAPTAATTTAVTPPAGGDAISETTPAVNSTMPSPTTGISPTSATRQPASTSPCPVWPGRTNLPGTVNILDATGDSALIDDLIHRLQNAGITVEDSGSTDSTVSTIQYPPGVDIQARALAGLLGAGSTSLTPADVSQITIVLGGDDARTVFAASVTDESCSPE